MPLFSPVTLRGKILLLVAALMAASAASALALVWLTYEEAVTREQESQAMETLALASLLIRDRTDGQTDRRLEAVMDQRQHLKQILDMFLATLEAEYEQRARGGATMQEAQRMALETAERASWSTGLNVFIFDKDFNGLSNAEKSLKGRSWRGLKGSVDKDALEFASQIVNRDGFDTLMLWWPEGDSRVEAKHLASLGYFRPWEWYVGVSVDYGRLESRALQDKNRMIRDVLGSLSRLRLGRSGGIFVMSEQGKSFLLLPEGVERRVVQTHAGQIVSAATSPETPSRFVWEHASGTCVAYVLNLPELAWKVGLVMDASELSAAAGTLAKRQMLAIGAVLAAGLALAWIITSRIGRPLQELTRSVGRLDLIHGAGPSMLNHLRSLTRRHPGEVGTLASAWADTLQALDSGIEQLKRAARVRETAALELAASKVELVMLNRELESRVKVRTAALEAANDRLRSSEARYRSLFMNSPVAFVEADLSSLATFMRSAETTALGDFSQLVSDKPETMRDLLRLISVHDANPAALDMVAARSVLSLSAGFDAVLLPESFPATLRLLQALADGVNSYTCEAGFQTFSGQRKHAVLAVRPMPGHESGLDRVLVSIQDVTGLKEGEALLRRAHREAQAASKAKSEFLANMSHEIRTPLSAILGLAELSQRQNEPVKTAKHLRMIAESAQALLGIIGDVLDLSRVEAGKLSLEIKRFALAQVVERAAQTFQAQCASKGLALRVELDPNLPRTLKGDPLRLGQILANLIGNAVKFTSQGGITVTVEPGQDAFGWRELHFCVKDTGIGIAPDKTGDIFELFQQADSSFSKPYQGVGLGLAICRELATLMGGRIWVDSVPGAGSAFHFTARFDEEAKPESETSPCAPERTAPERPPLSGTSRLCVLVAEDNLVNRHVFKEFLASLGHDVTTAKDGAEALEILSRTRFDLVFMDVQMPRLDGLEAVRRIRAGACGGQARAVPVVALTAYAMSGDRERFLEAGMTGYLPKPVSLDALQRTLAEHARAEDAAPQAQVRTEDAAPQAQVRTEDAREAFQPLMAEFSSFIRERADTALAHLEAGELDLAARVGHDVKGTSMAFGVDAVNALGARIEKAAREGDAASALVAARELLEIMGNFSDEPGKPDDAQDHATQRKA